jgi:tripartite-type tricarboxylate transporter receptor subunit TctC
MRLIVFAVVAAFSAAACGAEFPSKPLRLIVPSAPGGGIDFTARVIAAQLTNLLGKTVVVDNRAGASGIMGSDTVAKAVPDGHTLLMASSSLSVAPHIYRNVPYDIIKDFAAVSLVARSPNLLVVHPSVQAKSVKDLIALAKAQPGSLNFSSAGNGRASHLAAERFKQMAGIDMTHVPYKGTGPAITAVVAGEVQLQFATVPSVLPHVKSGRLRALGIGSVKRSSVLPEAPTITESGLPGYEADTWYGLLVPAATNRTVVQQLNAATLKALQTQETRDKFLTDGSEPVGSTSEEFRKYLVAEVERWGKVVRAAGIKPE